jgi:hypothetical protein
VWLCICWWQKTIWQKQWSDSDETVMEQWCNSVFGDTSPFDKNSDQTEMRQWWNSFAFDFSPSMSFSRFWDVIEHILSFCNALEVCLMTQDLVPKIVIKQSSNSDVIMIVSTVMYLVCLVVLLSYSFDRAMTADRRRKANYSSYRQANWTEKVSTSINSTRAFFWYQGRLDL